jgi:hypothetical protein
MAHAWQVIVSAALILFAIVMAAVEWSVSQARSRRR